MLNDRTVDLVSIEPGMIVPPSCRERRIESIRHNAKAASSNQADSTMNWAAPEERAEARIDADPS